MPKKRKTRKQKMQASIRHQAVQTAPIASPQNDIRIPERFTLTQPTNTFTSSALYPHQYLKSELLRIALLSVAIVVGELILFFLLRNHIILLPNLQY